MPRERLDPQERDNWYVAQLILTENLLNTARIDHRFVGGTFTDLLTPRTQVAIDFEGKTIQLRQHLQPQALRSDGTTKDIDLIAFCPDSRKFERTKQFINAMKKRGFPGSVSMEPTRYPSYGKHNSLLQFVSGIEVDENGLFYLTFGDIRQKIDPRTFESWKVILMDIEPEPPLTEEELKEYGADMADEPPPEMEPMSFTILNPFAHALRYCMRVPSGVKKKDKERTQEGLSKISILMGLGMQVAKEAEKRGIDYRHDLYKPWIDFIRSITRDQEPSMVVRRMITGTYWDLIGTAVAHGRGIFRPLAELGDRFTG